MTEAAKKNIVVIGSGIVGACSALELVRDGHQVTLLDIGEAGGRQAASYGHGCWISPASVVPMSTPGLWKKIPGFLLDRRGPLVIRWRNLIQLLPWLLRFLVAGSSLRRVEATALALDKLLHDSPERHEALALEVGSPALIRKEGLLYVYPDRQAFEEEKISWRLRKLTGLRWQELDKPALKAREPGLDNRYGFGILAERGAHCVDPGAYVAKIVDKVRERGGQIIHTKATGFHLKDGCLQGVETEFGILACNAAVVSAGAWSKPSLLMPVTMCFWKASAVITRFSRSMLRDLVIRSCRATARWPTHQPWQAFDCPGRWNSRQLTLSRTGKEPIFSLSTPGLHILRSIPQD